MIQLVYLAFIVISFLAGLTVAFQRNTSRYLRLFTVFLFLTLVVEIISLYLNKQGRKSTLTIVYSFFTSFEFLFYLYVLREIIRNKLVKKIVFTAAWLYLLLVILNTLFVQKTTT